MAPPWVNLDVTPTLGRPEAVARAIADTTTMRDRVRQASEQLAAVQATVDELERDDVQAAAIHARAGEALGAPPAALKKAREQLELAKREDAARQLALQLAEHDLADAMTESAGAWLTSLDDAAAQARTRGAETLAKLEHALADLSAATSAAAWVRAGVNDARWDRRAPTTMSGSVAPSSRHVTANSAPLDRATLLGYCAELVAEPVPVVAIIEPVATDTT